MDFNSPVTKATIQLEHFLLNIEKVEGLSKEFQKSVELEWQDLLKAINRHLITENEYLDRLYEIASKICKEALTPKHIYLN